LDLAVPGYAVRPSLVGLAKMAAPGCRLGPWRVRVVEAPPGHGRTEHLAITPIEVSLRVVPRSHDGIPPGKARP
jgi:hypothetical protein